MSAWLLAARPKTLPAAVVPVVVGSALAARLGGFDLLGGALCLLGALLLQVAVNLANDVQDFERGADGPDRLGPVRAAASGLLTPRALWTGLVLVLVLATGVGAALVARAGWPILAIGGLSLLGAVSYTGGPALGYRGLGELMVFFFFGVLAVGGTVFVHTGTLPPAAVLAMVLAGAPAAALMVVNNLRDAPEDVKVGKRTLAVRLGPVWTRRLWLGCHLAGMGAAVALGVLVLSPALALAWALLLVLGLGHFVNQERRALLVSTTREDWGARLGGTARLLLGHGVLAVVLLAGPWS